MRRIQWSDLIDIARSLLVVGDVSIVGVGFWPPINTDEHRFQVRLFASKGDHYLQRFGYSFCVKAIPNRGYMYKLEYVDKCQFMRLAQAQLLFQLKVVNRQASKICIHQRASVAKNKSQNSGQTWPTL